MKTAGRWQIHANYKADQHDTCIDSAKALYVSRRFEATRVVRETFNPADNRYHDVVLYRSPCRPKPKPKARPRFRQAQARIAQPLPLYDTPAPRQATRAALPRIAGICVLGLGGAALVAFPFSLLLKSMPGLHASLGRAGSEIALFVSFTVSFLMIFIPLLRRVLKSLQDNGATQPAGPVTEIAPPADPSPEVEEPEESEEPEEPEEELPDEDAEGDDAELADAEDESDDTAQEEFTTEAAQAAAEVATAMLQFIGVCLAPLAEAKRPLDAFNRFGLTMRSTASG